MGVITSSGIIPHHEISNINSFYTARFGTKSYSCLSEHFYITHECLYHIIRSTWTFILLQYVSHHYAFFNTVPDCSLIQAKHLWRGSKIYRVKLIPSQQKYSDSCIQIIQTNYCFACNQTSWDALIGVRPQMFVP